MIEKNDIVNNCKIAANNMRRTSMKMAYETSQNSHFGAALSIIDILAVLYRGVMRYNPNDMKDQKRDRFILSKGHGVLALYSALYESGLINESELTTFVQNATALTAHPVRCIKKGIEFSSGSLGMGLSLGIGMAIAGQKRKLDYNIYVLMGNGECNEGSVWEAVMFAAHHNLSNVIAIVDNNNMQSDGNSDNILKYDIQALFIAHGWETIRVDGHNIEMLYEVISRNSLSNKPRAIIADTIKGKGISFMENNNEWHHNKLNQEKFELAINELTEEVNS